MLEGVHLGAQVEPAPLQQGLMFNNLALGKHLLLSAKIDIGGRDIVERFVIAFDPALSLGVMSTSMDLVNFEGFQVVGQHHGDEGWSIVRQETRTVFDLDLLDAYAVNWRQLWNAGQQLVTCGIQHIETKVKKWVKSATTGVVTDLARSKPELIAENAFCASR